MRVTCTCQTCGKAFLAWPSQHRKYCSPECAYQIIKGSELTPHVTLHCLECGKEIRKSQAAADKGLGHFCSASCRGKHYPHRHPPGTEFAPRVEVPCASCGALMRLTQAEVNAGRRFCSVACINAGRPSKRNQRISKACIVCGKKFWTPPSTAERHQYCSRQCLGHAHQQHHPRAMTSIEALLMAELDRRGITFDYNYPIPPWVVDIAFPEQYLAVEADGSYWHNLPGAPERDATRNADLNRRGWTVLRFGEAEIHASPAKCVDNVLEHLRNAP